MGRARVLPVALLAGLAHGAFVCKVSEGYTSTHEFVSRDNPFLFDLDAKLPDEKKCSNLVSDMEFGAPSWKEAFAISFRREQRPPGSQPSGFWAKSKKYANSFVGAAHPWGGREGRVYEDKTCCNRFEFIPVHDCCAQQAMAHLNVYDNLRYKKFHGLPGMRKYHLLKKKRGDTANNWSLPLDFKELMFKGVQVSNECSFAKFDGCKLLMGPTFCDGVSVSNTHPTKMLRGKPCEVVDKDASGNFVAPIGWGYHKQSVGGNQDFRIQEDGPSEARPQVHPSQVAIDGVPGLGSMSGAGVGSFSQNPAGGASLNPLIGSYEYAPQSAVVQSFRPDPSTFCAPNLWDEVGRGVPPSEATCNCGCGIWDPDCSYPEVKKSSCSDPKAGGQAGSACVPGENICMPLYRTTNDPQKSVRDCEQGKGCFHKEFEERDLSCTSMQIKQHAKKRNK